MSERGLNMTEREAIEGFKIDNALLGENESGIVERNNIAIKCIEEVQEYRSICDSTEKLKIIDALYLERCEEINRLKAELTEKEEEFCEWKFEETTGIVWHCGNECTTYNLPYAKNLEIILKDFECKCPYCGRKIKEVQV